MTVERVNPELILKAGELVVQGDPLRSVYLKTDGSNEVRIQRKYGGPGNAAMKSDREFNPLESDDDAMKLERALKHRGNGWWSFSRTVEAYQAISAEHKGVLHDKSDTLLLLRCVSAQFSIPLYLESK